MTQRKLAKSRVRDLRGYTYVRPCLNNAHLNAQEFLSKSGVPHTDISHGTGDEEVRATGGEYYVVHAGEVAGTAQLRFHVHRYPVPVATQSALGVNATSFNFVVQNQDNRSLLSFDKSSDFRFSDDFTVQMTKLPACVCTKPAKQHAHNPQRKARQKHR